MSHRFKIEQLGEFVNQEIVSDYLVIQKELREGSKVVLPNFTEMVKISDSKEGGKRYFDLSIVKEELEKYRDEISKCEIYYNKCTTVVENLPENCEVFDI